MSLRNVGRVALALCIACLLWLSAAPAWGQETASVVGTVTDASGAVIPGATATLTNIGTGVVQTATTNGTGDYDFPLLQVGTYSVKVEAKGFKTYTVPSIPLSAGDRFRADAKLQVGEAAQTVEVSGAVAPALQTDTSNIGSLVPAQSVQDLPLNGRNLIQLVQLQPGVTSGSPGSIVQGNRPDDRRLISSFSVNGQVDTMNNNLIDGMDNNERIIGTIGVRPSIDAVQEMSIQTNKYDASVGRTGGGVVDVITKSGTNDFHGSAYEFFRNKVLNANPNYSFGGHAAANPAFRQNQYGGSLGGPIKKNKTFFFGDYEKLDYATGTNIANYTVPTLCERGSVLAGLQGYKGSSISCPDGTSPTAPGDFSDEPLISPVGGGSSSCVLSGTGTLYGSAACPYLTVPSTSITPLGMAYFSMYPIPTCGPGTGATCTLGSAAQNSVGTFDNYQSAPVKTFASDTWDARVDQHFSDRNTFYGRFTHNGETTINPNGFPAVRINPSNGDPVSTGGVLVNPVVLAYAGPNKETQDQLELSYVHVYSASLVLNLKFGVLRSNIDSEPINELSDVSNNLGFPCGPTACVNAEKLVPSVVGSGLATATYSSVNGGISPTGMGDTSFIPLREYDTAFQYLATLTQNHGNHSIRYGISLIRRRATIGQSNNPQGTFTFTGGYTGVPFGDLLEGLNTTQSRNNALDQPGFRTWEPSIYVQDDWRARPWLTLNLGIRYDIFTPYTEVHGRISNYDPYLGLLVSPAIPGIQQSGPTAMVPTPYHDVAPRFGFSASLPHQAVLRGGFGLTFFPVNYESPYYMKNAPFGYSESCTAQNETATNASCANAVFGSAAPGQFENSAQIEYGQCPYSGGSPAACQSPTTGSGLNSASNVYNTNVNGGATTGATANLTPGVGGALFSAGLPVPALNIALATNPANYVSNGGIAAIPINLRENYLEQFNLELQKQFGANVIDIGYVGQIGRDVAPLNSATNQNSPANPTENHANALPMVVGGDSYYFGQLPSFPYFSTVGSGASEEANIGTSFYSSLQTSFVRRFSNGLTVNFNYVWSHMTDNVDGGRACVLSVFASPEPCWYDLSKGTGPSLSAATSPNACAAEGLALCKNVFGWQHGDWGNGAQDVADRFTWGINYDLPFAKSATGVEGVLVKGWAINTSGSWQTGLPFNVTPASNTTGISGAGYLDQICSGRLANADLHDWFNYNCFVHPVAGTLGHMDPNQLFGPPQRRLDFSLFKTFQLNERFGLQFRTEVFNLFNTVNFNTPAGTSLSYQSLNGVANAGPINPGVGTPAGSINAVNANWAPRQIQFALKVLF
ncbi:MAG TPA: carboxypeptidase regulatory-like domain-containing protein [Candidatus Aquilonibacter sp.]|nr:carboxypeptidase regulatory-like domain-containing protein [Candidatus Aquilonibacter sp.]